MVICFEIGKDECSQRNPVTSLHVAYRSTFGYRQAAGDDCLQDNMLRSLNGKPQTI